MKDQELIKRIANNITIIREDLGLSKTQASRKVDVSPQLWGVYERAKTTMTITMLYLIAEALDCSPVDILEMDSFNERSKDKYMTKIKLKRQMQGGNQ